MSEPFISELRLQNFKCYEDLTLQLKSGMNLLYGMNGAGKTAILQSLAITAASYLVDFPGTGVVGWDIEPSFVRLVTPNKMREPEYQLPVHLQSKGNILGENVEWSVEFRNFSEGTIRPKDGTIGEISKEIWQIAQNGREVVLPAMIFFSTRRLFVERIQENIAPGRTKGYFNSFSGINTQIQIRNWLKDAEYVQYQKRISDSKYFDPGLKCIYDRILIHFGDEWERMYYFQPYDGSHLPAGLIFVPKESSKTSMPESNLSDGYRNFLWLILEIAWRCYVLNPHLGEAAADETDGIVLIDEVDLHLHPQWQQVILGTLTKAFPKIQFVITTHSPIVLGSVQEDQVILLEGQTARVVPAPYGLTPSYILESYMGIEERLPELQADIRRYFELINQGVGKNEEALAIRSRLESVMSPNDPIFAEADSLLYYLT